MSEMFLKDSFCTQGCFASFSESSPIQLAELISKDLCVSLLAPHNICLAWGRPSLHVDFSLHPTFWGQCTAGPGLRGTCAIHPIIVALSEGAVDELLCRQVWAFDVPPGKLQGADHELPWHAHGQGTQQVVQHIHLHVGDGVANRHRGPALVHADIIACTL